MTDDAEALLRGERRIGGRSTGRSLALDQAAQAVCRCHRCGRWFPAVAPSTDIEAKHLCGTCAAWDEMFS